MRIDLPAPDAWAKLCDLYRTHLPTDESLSPMQAVHVHAGYSAALWECTQGLARLFTHKKTVAVIGQTEPAIEAVAQTLSSEGYAVKYVAWSEVGDIAKWLDPIQAELLFVIYSKDDPATGRLFDVSKIEAVLKDKRVFRLALSHAAHRFSFDRSKLAPFEIRILSMCPERALIVAGERFRALPLLAPSLPWARVTRDDVMQDLGHLSENERVARRARVLDFESALPRGFRPYFASGDLRLFDRAVICSTEFDGAALLDELSAKLGCSLASPGAEGLLETTSLCRWESRKLGAWLASRGDTEADIRGTLVIDAASADEKLLRSLEAAVDEVRNLQDG